MAHAPIKLAVVSTSLTGGGAERFTSNLASGLNPDVFDISLFLVRAEVDYPLRSAVRVLNLGKKSPWHYPRTVGRLRRWLVIDKPDVILSTIAFTARLTGFALLGWKDAPPWVVRLGNNPARDSRKPIDRLDRWLFRKGCCAVGNSLGLAEDIRHRYQYWRNKTFMLRTPIDFATIDTLAAGDIASDTSAELPVILSVGRLIRQKRNDILLRAFRQVRSHQAAQLWICGGGPLEQQLQSWVRAHNLDRDVRFLGFQSNPYALMHRADIFALTSDYEGMPNALIEAQGLGLPAVATRCDYGPAEIVEDGRTGMLVDIGDAPAAANAMLTLIRDESLRREMGAMAASRVRGMFQKDQLIDQWSELLLRLGRR